MDDDPSIPEILDPESEEPFSATSPSNIVKLYIFFLLMFQSTFRISDTALTVLLSFLFTFLQLLAKHYHIEKLHSFCDQLPKTTNAARKLIGDGRNDFEKYACCPSCYSIYSWLNKGTSSNNTCTFIKYPNHSQARYRKPCGEKLMKMIKTPYQASFQYPRLLFCYKPIIKSLQEMLFHPKFISHCELWRDRQVCDGVMHDIYDGKVWDDFLEYEGKSFLSAPFNYALCLNVDWFQPFDHTQHSEGVAYLSILNLPRKERYLQENIILLGVIPGPNEPPYNINSFLQPFVHELCKLWQGVIMTTNEGINVLVRAALLCCACDIPAARKVCGFVGHNGLKGCSKCLLEFPTTNFGDKPDYTNIDRAKWTPRNVHDHKLYAMRHKCANTRAQEKVIERAHGCRYSVLNDLPYFDPPRMCIIDPMHNLLLGTGKHMVTIWKSLEILSDDDFDLIQIRANSFCTPNNIGRVPSKIASGFSGFTAEQWKNWIVYFSLYALNGILPKPHYECWQHFVKACFYLCRRTITRLQIQEADKYLMEFYGKVVALYGNAACNPNLHLHGHLRECINDYGPVYSFWLFAFERLNGILGSYHTNNRNISLQLMRRFLDSKTYAPCNWPSEYKEEFLSVLEQFNYQKGSLQQTSLNDTLKEIHALPPLQEDAFSVVELTSVSQLASSQYPEDNVSVLMLHRKCKTITLNGSVIGSQDSRHSNSSIVLAKSPSDTTTLKLYQILFFMECKLIKSSDPEGVASFWVAAASKFMEHEYKGWFGCPIEVWCAAPNSIDIDFIPISSIKTLVAYTKTQFNFQNNIGEDLVYIIAPIEHNQ